VLILSIIADIGANYLHLARFLRPAENTLLV
jgi:hypothetical protein